jgi:hypothetical protein
MKVYKMLALACAVACAGGGFADNLNWFSGSVVATNNATFNSPDGVTVENSEFKLDTDINSPLSLTPNESEPALSDGIVIVESKAIISPTDFDMLPTDLGGAKAGFTVAVNGNVTNFYGYVNGVWHCLTGVDVPENENTEISFQIVLNYRDGLVSFFVKSGDNYVQMQNSSGVKEFSMAGPSATATAQSADTVQSVDCFGCGTLTSIDAKVEKSVAAVTIGETTKKYGSVAEALAHKGNGVIKDVVVNSDGTVSVPDSPTTASNGLLAWQNDALNIANNETIQLEPAQHTDNAINLKLKTSPDDGIAVSFKVKKADGTYVKEGSGDNSNDAVYPSNSISIPLGTGKYTIEPVFSAAQQQ